MLRKKEKQKEREQCFSGNPFKGLFGKLEHPKYPDFWQGASDEEKKELELFFNCFFRLGNVSVIDNVLYRKNRKKEEEG